ncbi:MAG: polymer-forming cytoskeletal protein [Acidobacteria bacterium]|nr:polymer-forming cytoskeletal protein [Acidobacteriota bacterium]MDW7984446.1 polymer-forming cytoskeletal protein [Acidobacteriota bacterium]
MKVSSLSESTNVTALLSEDISVEGKLRFQGSLRIEGTFKGQIEGGQELVLGKRATVEGTVQVDRIFVHGALRCEEVRADRLEIFPEGRVQGRIVVQSLVVHEGGILQAECIMEEAAQPRLVAGHR